MKIKTLTLVLTLLVCKSLHEESFLYYDYCMQIQGRAKNMDMDTIIKQPLNTKVWVLRSNHQEDIVLQGQLIVGRDPECDICIPDHRISRQHAKILITSSGLIVQDLNSRNGTTVNDEKINSPKLCQTGDQLKFHNLPFTVETLPPETNEVLVLRATNQLDIKLQGQLVVGRDSACEVYIDNELVSRKHATITSTKLGVIIEDLNSINGTFVNDFRIVSPARLKAGDSVRFHENTFSVEKEIDPDATIICVGTADPDATVCAGAIVNNIRSHKSDTADRKKPEPEPKPSTPPIENQKLSAIQKQASKNINKLNQTLSKLNLGVWVELTNLEGECRNYCLISTGGGTGSLYSFIAHNGLKLVKKDLIQIELAISSNRLKILDNKPFLRTKLALVKGTIVKAISV